MNDMIVKFCRQVKVDGQHLLHHDEVEAFLFDHTIKVEQNLGSPKVLEKMSFGENEYWTIFYGDLVSQKACLENIAKNVENGDMPLFQIKPEGKDFLLLVHHRAACILFNVVSDEEIKKR